MVKKKQRLTNRLYEKIAAVGVAFAILLLFGHFVVARPAAAQVQNGISEPQDGAVLTGIVSIQGTATHESFLRYELAFNSGADWLVFAEGDQPVVDGTLAIWDTTVGQPASPVFPDGIYQLRLRVVRQDYNYDEYFVGNLTVSNATTPTPSPTATIVGDGTPQPGTPGPGATPTTGLVIIRPTPLPSLTPFPTPTPPATPANGVSAGGSAGLGDEATSSDNGGLLQRFLDLDTGRFGRAFWAGVRIAIFGFAFLALYLLLRTLARYVWRRVWAWVYREEKRL